MRRLLPVLVLALAACGGAPAATPATSPPTRSTPSPSRATTSSAPVVVPKAPSATACYQYDAEAAVAPTNDSAPVPCTGKHDARTFFVGRLDQVVAGHLVSVDSDRAHRQIATTCPARLTRFLGGSPDALRLSVLSTVWFTPTVTDSDAGANWFRCDVVAPLAGTLMPLTRSLKGILGRPDAARKYGRCRVSDPGGSTGSLVPCSGTHRWRAVTIVPLGSGSYPGETSVQSAGQTTCRDVGRSRAADPLSYRWAYEWPTRDQWAAGQTWGYCWVPD